MILLEGRDITPLCGETVWSGSLTGCTRRCLVEMAPAVVPEVGEELTLTRTGRQLFTGIVTYVDAGPRGVRIRAADRGLYLTRNLTFREYVGTPQAIARQVCGEFGVTPGQLAAVNRTVTLLSAGSSAWEVIQEAYLGTEKQRHAFRMEGEVFSVRELSAMRETRLPLPETPSRLTVDMEKTVNRVTILNRKGRRTGEAEDTLSRARYGTFGSLLREKAGVDSLTAARGLLSPPSEIYTLFTPDFAGCLSGERVLFTDPLTGRERRGQVLRDTHTLSPMGEQTELEVELL